RVCVCVLARTIQFSKNRPLVRPWRPTDVFGVSRKRLRESRSHRREPCRGGCGACRRRPRLGEPCEVTRTRHPCQPPVFVGVPAEPDGGTPEEEPPCSKLS